MTDTPSVPPPSHEQKAWITALRQAAALRAAQRYEYELLTGPRIRTVMADVCPLLAAPGIESPVTLRAIAAGVTLIHPAALLLMLAGADLTAPTRRRSRIAQRTADAEAWLRRQLGALEEPR